MKTAIEIAGFATLLIGSLTLLAAIIASAVTRMTPWAKCPRCGRWHNDIGEIVNEQPEHGRLIAQRMCPECDK